jgi:RNA polymerase sigma factor (sigma-70 family)
MATPNVELTRQCVRRLVAAQADPGVADRELLRRFAERQDQAAFEALLRRHGPMVLATARRLLGNAHDAEDVLQAAFLLLAQKADSTRWQPSVANWLYTTAHRLALRVQRSAGRRTRREARAAARTPAEPLAEMSGQELLAVLDAELLALPESIRAPLVLCYLEGATRDEAAERLACTPAALKKRLERGRSRLLAALERRGIGLPAALLAALLSGHAARATPDVIERTARAVEARAAGRAESLPPQVDRLLKGGTGVLGTHKLKAAFGVLFLGGVLAAASAGASSGGDDRPAPPPPGEAKEQPPASPVQQPKAVRVVVLAPDGKPLPGTNVHASVWTDVKGFKANRDVETDAAGVAAFELPERFTTFRLWASKKAFVQLFANWEQAELSGGKGVPAEYTFRMEAAVAAGGRVVNETGEPIAGARVEVHIANDPKPTRGDGRVRYDSSLAWGEHAPATDADGRWRIDNAPAHPEAEFRLQVSHADYASEGRWDSTRQAGLTTALRKESATVTLKPGVIVRGRVTDPDGKPIKGAVVVSGDSPYFSAGPSKFATDADGRFRLPALAPGKSAVTVIAPGFAPQYRKLDLKPDLPPQDFRMAAGKPVRLRLVDADGRPIPRAYVSLQEWKGSKSIDSFHNPNHPKVPDTGVPKRADADGVWTWTDAPAEPVKVLIEADGFGRTELTVAGGVTDQSVTLKGDHRVTGTVTDAATGKPVPRFTVVPIDVFRKDFLSAERGHASSGTDGKLDFPAHRTDIPLRLRIEAPGYRTQDGPEFRAGDAGAREQSFRLVPSRPITGTVVDVAGRPAAKAEVLLATPTEQAQPGGEWDNHRTFTDAAGRFEFPDPGEPWAVVARADAGTAVAEFPADSSNAGTLKLRAWAAVRGTFRDGGRPVAKATVTLHPIRLDGPGRPVLRTTLQVTTDADGRFEFPRVPPGPVSVRVYLGPWEDPGFRSGPHVPLDLKPGEQSTLELGSGGAVLSGRVKLTGRVPADLDCTYSINYLVRREPGVTPPPDVAAAGFDVRKGWRDTWPETHEGLAYLSTLRSWFVKLAPDGSFRVNGVPAGEYDLAVAVYAKPSGCLVTPLARQVGRVTVTAADVARGEVKVADVAAAVAPGLAVGDTPALKFKRADGKEGTLADCRDKYTVVHFWASWCAPCKKQIPALKDLYARYFASDLAVLSLSLDDDPAAWTDAVKGLDLPWSQGRLGTDNPSGVSAVPTYWLLDPAGKIVATANDLDELTAAVEKGIKPPPKR